MHAGPLASAPMTDEPRLVAGIDPPPSPGRRRDARTESRAVGPRRHPDGPRFIPTTGGRVAEAIAEAGGLDDWQPLSVGGQQHGMVLPRRGRSRRTPRAAVERHPFGGAAATSSTSSAVPRGGRAGPRRSAWRPSRRFTVTELALARRAPARTTPPHGWCAFPRLAHLEAVRQHRPARPHDGTQRRQRDGYWSAPTGDYRDRPAGARLRGRPHLPRVVALGEVATTVGGTVLGAGAR